MNIVQIEARFQQSPNRIIRFPTQKYVDLAPFFQSADLALIPVQCSLSLFDLNAAGVPVLAEDNDVNVVRCGYGNGWTFRAGDLQDFQEAALVLPRWVLGALNSSARICPAYRDFIEIAQRMDYRTQMATMRTFPEKKARWLALFLRIAPMVYYRLIHRTRKGNL